MVTQSSDSVCRVPVSAIVRSCDMRIGSMRVCVECVILVGSCIVFVKLLCWSIYRVLYVMVGCLKNQQFRSPRIMILSECSLLFSKDQEKFFQKVESVVGGRYTQHKKKFEVPGFSISIQIHSTLTGSKFMRRRAWIELDK